MTDFYRENIIERSRKDHRCDGCRRIIPVGSKYLRYAGVYDGDFGCFAMHVDCRAAEVALNKIHDPYEWVPLSEFDDEDRPWIRENYPEVAARMFGNVEAAL